MVRRYVVVSTGRLGSPFIRAMDLRTDWYATGWWESVPPVPHGPYRYHPSDVFEDIDEAQAEAKRRARLLADRMRREIRKMEDQIKDLRAKGWQAKVES